ncbi:hypothetical protein CANARDRAFT_29017 [[Candida] arabinofermentans NRRL YB-2248]|uniref:Uncharacterized protein n=1 Tax=[Candida] arabinofermentans NRRL YB-2248 TaxID=983967 RepID=A0A1E4SY92_9ASCO|nr:hypothetical protein CANARDRAFT_29017 [[Candida] arabinofermentans NRRL YB-2248]
MINRGILRANYYFIGIDIYKLEPTCSQILRGLHCLKTVNICAILFVPMVFI